MPLRLAIACLMTLTTHLLTGSPVDAEDFHVYVGTYTRGDSEGIYRFTLDSRTGEVSEPELAAKLVNPSFLAIHPSQPLLYAVNEVSGFNGNKKAGGVSGFSIKTATGALEPINSQLSGGAGPCHLIVDLSGSNVLVANYGGGSVAALPIGEGGALQPASSFIQHEGSSVNPRRQAGPHAHSINVDPANKFAFVADLGLDKVLVYQLDPQAGKLAAHDPPSVSVRPGAGPRHFAFHPSGKFAYVINELESSITAFAYDGEGKLTPRQTITTLPLGFDGNNSTAEVLVHPSGKFVYGSNRGHNSIAVFRVGDDGTLESVEQESTQGEIPRNFRIDPTGRFLLAANQNTHNIVLFRIDQKSGALEPTGTSLNVPSPVCLRMVPRE